MVELTKDQAIARFRSNESNLMKIEEQGKSIARVLEEIRMTARTLTDLPDKDVTGMVPMGGLFLPVKANASQVNVDIGSGVIVEQNREEALETLKKREKSLQETLRNLQETASKISADSREIRQKLAGPEQPNMPVISG